jgi:hypothetical protein
MQSLKNYKSADHKAMFVTFDNPEAHSGGQAQRLSALPDSIDYIVLNNATALAPVTLEDMNAVREKSTKVIYNINYDSFEAEWLQILRTSDRQLTEEDLLAHITRRTREMVALCQTLGYDGFVVGYSGRSPVSMTPEATQLYEARQKRFFDPIVAWRNANPKMALSFSGNPQYLTLESKSLLAKCDYIILPTSMMTGTADMETAANMATASGSVPADRFVFSVYTTQYDDANYIYGYFGRLGPDGAKVRSLPLTAQWVGQTSKGYVRAGMLINRVQYDYYDTGLVYRQTREAIATMNPSPKN